MVGVIEFFLTYFYDLSVSIILLHNKCKSDKNCQNYHELNVKVGKITQTQDSFENES